jgi:aminoglycoside phosphotransferase (APT) family kinase protein
MPVDIDLKIINDYVETQNIAGLKTFESINRLSGGRSNPNYLLSNDDGRYVLRRQPFGTLLKTAHNVSREFRVMQALSSSVIPVPQLYHLCIDKAILGVDFYIMAYIEGDNSADFSLNHVPLDQRRITYNNMIDLLAALHNLDYKAVGLADYGVPGNYYERQYSRWEKSFRISMPAGTNHFNKLSQWLHVHLPKGSTTSLIHGDFRLDNLLFHNDTRQILALLDWELSTLGDPLSDLGYFLGILNTPSDFVIPGLKDIDRAELGIPSEAALLQRYCDATGRASIENWPFYKAFGFFRLSAICAGIQARVLQGNAVDGASILFGSLTDRVAEIGLEQLDT